MALPRIRYAFDGTVAYQLSLSGVKNILSSDSKNKIDGDQYKDDTLDIGARYLLFNFPDTVQLDKVGLKMNSATTGISFQISTDSTDGIDGSWSTLLTDDLDYAYTYQEFALTPTDATWLKLTRSGGFTFNPFRCAHLFGEYQNPLFELWNTGESAELNTVNYPMSLSDAPNSADYAGSLSFKLKNTDSSTHNYSLTVAPIKYGGDSIITNYFKLSTDGGSTKNLTVTVSSLGAGNFSAAIGVYGDLTKANNPADGKHYFTINVTQTA
jgi:hypothetical protein